MPVDMGGYRIWMDLTVINQQPQACRARLRPGVTGNGTAFVQRREPDRSEGINDGPIVCRAGRPKQSAGTSVRPRIPDGTSGGRGIRDPKPRLLNGYLTETLRKKIFSAFCFWDHVFALVCLSAVPTRAGMKGSTWKTEASNEDVIAVIEGRLERLGAFREYVVECEKLAVDAEARSFSLPSADATDKLLRYESHLDRQLYRAMDQLERLQRRRRGENVPPPRNINLGRRS